MNIDIYYPKQFTTAITTVEHSSGAIVGFINAVMNDIH